MCGQRPDNMRVRLHWRFGLADDICHPHVVCMSSTGGYVICMLSAHGHMSSTHHLPIVRTTPYGQRGPELSFTVTGICYLMEFVAGMLNCFISGSCK